MNAGTRSEMEPTVDDTVLSAASTVGIIGGAAAVLSEAQSIECLTVEEISDASGRSVAWLRDVLDGTLDPTIDELQLVLNAIGLEMRITVGELHPGSLAHKYSGEGLAEQIQRRYQVEMEMYGQTWKRRSPPQPSATARLFGAGPGRTDGGGRAALLLGNVLNQAPHTCESIATNANMDTATVQSWVDSQTKPSYSTFKNAMQASGLPMTVWLDEYCDDDDQEHEAWLEDPEGYEATLASLRAQFQAAKRVTAAITTTT